MYVWGGRFYRYVTDYTKALLKYVFLVIMNYKYINNKNKEWEKPNNNLGCILSFKAKWN